MKHRASVRWGVFVWDADGDMGDAVVVGPFRDDQTAEIRAESIRRRSAANWRPLEAMVVPVAPFSDRDAISRADPALS